MAYSAFLHPDYGVAAAYAKTPEELHNAVAVFLAAWFIITFLFL